MTSDEPLTVTTLETKPKSMLKGLVKIGISLAMLGLVLTFVDLNTLRRTLLSIPWYIALMAVVGYSLTMVISSLKWWLIAREGNILVPYPRALKAVFIGMFANCFSLGTVTGDMLRGVILTRDRAQKIEGIVSVFADRALGLAMLSLVGVVATATLSGHHLEPVFVYILCAVAGVILAAWFIGPFVILRIVPKGNALRAKIEEVIDVFARDPSALVLVCLISVVFHLMQISLQWLIARGIHIDVSLASMLVTIPFVNILSTLPISWNGLGVRENAYILLLAQVFTKEQAVAVGAVWLFGLTVSGLVGGIVAVVSGDLKLMRRPQS